MIGRFARLGSYKELFDIKALLLCLLGGGLALAALAAASWALSPAWLPDGLALAALGINGLPIVWQAVKGLAERRVNVDELVSLAIVACVLQGELLTAAAVGFIMTLGSLAEEAISQSARRSIQALARMTPQEVILLGDEGQATVPIAQVKVGDRLLVKPGGRVPVDGIILAGMASLDESTITGESMPRLRRQGEPVLASTLDLDGVLEIRATGVGEDSALGQVIRLISQAEAHKPRPARLIDRYARWFTPLVLFCAGLAWWWSGEAGRAVAVLVAGCPCALLLAAPTASVAAMARAARAGILIKDGGQLEETARVDVILFDKTGTLTLGQPRVEEVLAGQGLSREEVIYCAAGVEQNCTHPLARAVMQAAHYARIKLGAAQDVLGELGLGVRARLDGSLVEVGSAQLGGGAAGLPLELRGGMERIQAQGATPLVVYRDHEPIGLLSVSDSVRDSARRALEALAGLGVARLGILSGDHQAAVERVARAMGIKEMWWELKPGDKLRVIERLQQEGHHVMFVGDGVNDGPALARADIGVAMGAQGAEVALETAGMVLAHDDVARLPFLVSLARRCLAVMKLNIGLGLLFNTLAVLGGGQGLLSPIMASLLHNAGSIVIVLISASLMLFPDRAATPAGR